jgi:hypothetical protein
MAEPTKEELEKLELEKQEKAKAELEAPKMDDYMARMLKATGKSIEQILEPVTDDEKLAAEKAKTAAKTPEQEAAEKKAAEEKAAADKKAEEEKASADKAAEEAKQKAQAATQTVRPVVLKKKEDPAERQKVEEDAAAKRTREEEEAYIAELTEEQKDEIQLARFAESNGKPGQARKLIDYFRKLDKFAEENPEATPESEDFQKFKEDNEPRLSPSERRRLESKMIKDEAKREAKEEMRKEFEPVVTELNEIKTKPVVNSVLETVESEMVRKPEGEAAAFDPEIYKKIKSMPYSQAVEEFPVEAPIVAGTMAAASELTKIWNDVIPVDENNRTHAWLLQFVATEEARMKALPREQQLKDGREFLSIAEFDRLKKSDPARANGYYTFDQAMLVDRIAKYGVQQYNAQLKKLERSGFVRSKPVEKKDDKAELEKKEETKTGGTGSPKATGSTMVGAGADSSGAMGIDNLPPHMRGAGKLMNVS